MGAATTAELPLSIPSFEWPPSTAKDITTMSSPSIAISDFSLDSSHHRTASPWSCQTLLKEGTPVPPFRFSAASPKTTMTGLKSGGFGGGLYTAFALASKVTGTFDTTIRVASSRSHGKITARSGGGLPMSGKTRRNPLPLF
ncbi:hypothetical protein PIB30_077775 [Stylosanthes scabra]|uniref:Uncharacterized protein n=1 Tax=Stylosanthes scabra TaxID=79078 RepID=A0ABU6YRF7_9FABA|nr:hypothetical protein [Stylosanthes scabra]